MLIFSKINVNEIINGVNSLLYEGILSKEIEKLILNCTKQKIEEHYEYSYLSSRIVLDELYKDNLDGAWFTKIFPKRIS